MRRSFLVVLAAALMVGVMATGALAASVHLKGGKNAEPSFTDNGPTLLTLSASAALVGLGQEAFTISITATANATATCTNPSGANQPPGQNPAPITTAPSVTPFPAGSAVNGNFSFTVTTTPVSSTIAGAPGCPNPKWTETITDLAYTSATITVRQPDTNGTGPVVLTVTCTFSPPTSDGAVSSSTVSCVSSP